MNPRKKPAREAIKKINFVVPLPPPVTGMTAVTRHLLDHLSTRLPVRVFNLAGRKFESGIATKLFRLYRCVLSCFWIALFPRKGEFAYMVSNAADGLYLTMLVAVGLRLKGSRIILHHHVYAYIDRSDRRMKYLDEIVAQGGMHVFLSEQMRSDFQSQYGNKTPAAVIHNGFTIKERKNPTEAISGHHLTLGHLSNLTLEKGLDTVIELFRKLRELNQPVRLSIAGGATSPEAILLIQDCQKDFPDDFKYYGPVYGPEKDRFYDSLDVFLLPSRYVNEAQPLVIIESQQFGCPVLATDRGTIRSAVGKGGAVYSESNFLEESIEQICQWIQAPKVLTDARQVSLRQADESIREGIDSLDAFTNLIVADCHREQG